MPDRLFHIRLDEEVLSKLVSTAKNEQRSVQALAVELISSQVNSPAAGSASLFGLRVFRDRDCSQLSSRLRHEAENCIDFFAFGLNLLDFLRESSWGHSALRAALQSNSSNCRLALEDYETPSFRDRLHSTHRLVGSKQSFDFTKSAKLHSVEEAKKRLVALKKEHPEKVQIRKLGLYPVFRWAVWVDGHIFYEPHCYRMHSPENVAKENIPAIEVEPGTSMFLRMKEHLDCVWDLGVEY